MREVFFEFQKKRTEQAQNNVKCQKFKDLKKCYQKVKQYNQQMINQINQTNLEKQLEKNNNSNNYGITEKKSSNIHQGDALQNSSHGGKDQSVHDKRESYPPSPIHSDPYQISNNKFNNILNNLQQTTNNMTNNIINNNNNNNNNILNNNNNNNNNNDNTNNNTNINNNNNHNNNQINNNSSSQNKDVTINNHNNPVEDISFRSQNPLSNGQNTAVFPNSNPASFIANQTVIQQTNGNQQNLISQYNSNQASFTNIPYLPAAQKQFSDIQQKSSANQQNQAQITKLGSNYQMPSSKQLQYTSQYQNINTSTKKANKQRDLAASLNINGGAFLSARRPPNNSNPQPIIGRKRSFFEKRVEEQHLEEKLQKYNAEKIQIVETVNWKDLTIGDIVILKRGQVAPADLLILESKGGRVSVDCSLIKGICDELIKQPTSVTSISDGSKIKQSVFEYRKILNGKLEYSTYKLKDGFKGYLKLSKDPKGEEIDNSNIIFRGSILRNCKWIYGLVVFAGHDCRIYKQSRGITSLRKSFFASKAQTFYTISLFQIILNILISMLFLYFQPFNYTKSGNYNMGGVQFYIVSYIMDYLNILPPLFYATIDIIDMINDFFQTWKYQQSKIIEQQNHSLHPSSITNHQVQTHVQNHQEKPLIEQDRNEELQKQTETRDNSRNSSDTKVQDDLYKLTKSISISDISLTNHVFFDKTGTITEDKFEVKSIYIRDQLYFLPDHQKLRTILPNFEKEYNAEKSIKNSSFELTNFPADQTEERNDFPTIKPAQDLSSFKASITYLQQLKKRNNGSETTIEDDNLEEEEKDIIKSNLGQSHTEDSDNINKSKQRSQNRQHSSFFQSSEDKQKLQLNQQSSNQGDANLFSPSNGNKILDGSHNMHGKRYSSQTDSEMHIHSSDESQFLMNLFDEYDGYYHQALLSLILCHQTNTSIERNSDSKQDYIKKNSLFKVEKEILQFAENFGYQFKWNNSTKGLQPTYHLKISKRVKDYHILAVNEYTDKRKRMSVLIKDPNADNISGAILIVRQALGQSLPDNLKNNTIENEKLIKNIRAMEGLGMRKFIYLKRELTEDQAMDYVQKYENAHKNLISNIDQREEIYNSVENELEVICMIGLQEKIKPDVEQFIHNLNISGIGTWMLSGDNFENNLAVSYQIGFIENDSQVLHLSSEDPDLLKLQIRQQIQLFKNFLSAKDKGGGNIQEVQNNIKLLMQNNGSQYNLNQKEKEKDNLNSPKDKEDKVSTPKSLNQSQGQFQRDIHHKNSLIDNSTGVNTTFHRRQPRKRSTSAWNQEKNLPQYGIFVSSKSLTTIFSDNYLKDHFSFLAYFSKSVIGYDLTPLQKAWFVRLVKQNFPGNPKTLSIGDSYNDSQMMQETDISVQIENCAKASISQFGDIIIKDYKSLSRLVFLTSRFFSEVYEELLVFCFYRSFLLGYMLLFFNLIDCTFGSSLWSGYDLLNYNTVFFVVSLIPYGFKKYKLFITYKNFTDQEQIVEQFRYNIKVFKKKKMMLFLYKVVGHSFIESLVLFVICYFNFDFGTTTDGKENSLIVLKRIGLIMLTFWVQVKFNIASNQSFLEMIFSHILHFVGVVVYLSFGAMINQNPSNFVEIEEMIYSPQMYITIISLMLFAIILQIFLENNMYIQKFFPFSYIIDKERFSEIKGEMNELKFNRQIQLEKNARNNRPETGLLYYKLIIENHLSKILNQIFKGNKQENMDPILQNLIQSEEISISQQDMSKVSLRFKNRDLEKKFLENLVKQWQKFNVRSQTSSLLFIEITLTIIAAIMYQFIIDKQSDQASKFQTLIIPQSISIVVILVFVVILVAKKDKLFFQLNMGVFMFRILFKIIQDLVAFTNLMLVSIIYSYNMNFAIFAKPHLVCMGSVLQNIIFIPLMIAQTSSIQNESSITIYFIICAIIYILNFMFTLIIQKYTLEETERKNFLQFSKMQMETQKVNNVLSILLPKFVRERISAESLSNEATEGRNQISEDQGEVAVMFLLICDFDEISQSENERIVLLLDNLFRYFDSLCQTNDVTKIETVGNSYVCAAGLKSVEEQNSRKKANAINPVRRMINLAFDMKNYVQNIKWGSQGQSMVIKIGIHYGKVMAGVIGYHKPQFSLIGDTVNTTSRVMSTGENGKITVSKQAFDQISSIFTSEYGFSYQQKNVEAKGKGILETFQIYYNKKNQFKHDKRRTQKTTLYALKKQTQYDKGKKQTIRQGSQNSPFRNNGRTKQYKKTNSNNLSSENSNDFEKIGQVKQQVFQFNSSEGVRTKSTSATHAPQPDTTFTLLSTDEKQKTSTNKFIGKKNSLNEIEEEVSKGSIKDIDSLMQRNEHSLNFNQAIKKLQNDPIITNPAITSGQDELFIPLQNSGQNNAKETTDIENNEEDEIENFKKNSTDNIQNDDQNTDKIQQNDINYILKPIQDMQDDPIAKISDIEPNEMLDPKLSIENNYGRRRMQKKLTRMINETSTTHAQIQHQNSVEKNLEQILKPESKTNIDRPPANRFMHRNSIRAINMKNGINSNRSRDSKQDVGSEIFPSLHNNLDQSANQFIQHCNLAEKYSDEIQDEYIEQERLFDLYDYEEEKQTQENLISFKKRFFIPSLDTNNQYVIQFINQTFKEQAGYRKNRITLLFLSYCIKTVLSLFNISMYNNFVTIICIRALFIISMLFFFIFRLKYFDDNISLFKKYIFIVFLFGTFSVIFESYYFNISYLTEDMKDQIWQLQAAESFFIFSTLSSLNSQRIEVNVLFFLIMLVNWIIIVGQSQIIIYVIYFLLYGGIAHTIFHHILLGLQINNFNTYQILKKKNNQQASLLNNLLPNHILDKFLNNRQTERLSLTDQIDNVTILFADISQFTKYSSQVQPEQVVKMLRSLFYEFDRSVQCLNLFKLYTIGDCYVVLSFTDISKRNPVEEAKNVIYMGLEMIRIIRNVRSIINFEELDMRIGVHTGRIIGGVIGTDIVRYDVYGADVTIANKMESNGERGKILISQVTYDLLINSQYQNVFTFTKKEEDVYIKSLDRSLPAYFAEINQMSAPNSSNILDP